MSQDPYVKALYGDKYSEKPSSNGHATAPKPVHAGRDGTLPADYPIWYDKSRKNFWTKDANQEWSEYSQSQLSLVLRSLGVDKSRFTEQGLHLVDDTIVRIMREKNVHFAGELAGYPVGMYEILNNRVLITRGPRIRKPQKGQFPTITCFLDTLLGEQRRYFDAWIKSALLSLKAGAPFRSGQVLGIAGPAGCGKSLLQNLITEILGGRSAKPYAFLTGETNFNADLFRAEHLCIEDEPASVDVRTRRRFAASIKGICVNQEQRYHPKGKEPMQMTPFWRLSITVNDDHDHLMVLPPLDDSLLDKTILLKAAQAVFPYKPDDLEKRKAFRGKLSAELPAYLYWLRSWRLPASMQNLRFGCSSFQNEELKQMIQDLEPEHRLWTLLNVLDVIPSGHVGWTGEARVLDFLLRKKDTSGQADKILYYPTACGVFLERLSRIYPENVRKVGAGGNRAKWHIVLPEQDDW